MGGVVTTVDAVTGHATLERETISRKQVAVADRIVLSKLDLANGGDCLLLSRLAQLNCTAPTLRADHGRVDTDCLFEAAALNAHSYAVQSQEHVHDHADSEIQTYTLVREAPIQAAALALFLETLAEHCGSDLLRLKGIINIAENPNRPAVIHGVQHVFHPPAWLERWPSTDRRSRMVFITRHIPQRWVQVLLEAISQEVAAVSK